VHGIGGSPSKFDASRLDIKLDRSYEEAFSEADVRRMRALVGAEAGKWAY
jgi:hypothetical protein